MKLSGQVVLSDGRVQAGTVHVADGVVTRIEEGRAGPNTLLPGFVDLHVHGGGGADVMDGAEGISRVAEFHLRRGTTALCPTTITRPLSELEAIVRAAGGVADGPDRARLLGVHLEGPFISPRRLGAQPPHTLDPDPDVMDRLLAAGPVAVVTLAPERPGGIALIRHLVQRGVRASLGHSECDAETAAAAFAAGAGGVTHLFNAMSGMHHRRPGLAAAALEAEDVTHELILDGHHVDPALFRIARRAARGRLALITDAIRACGQGEGESELGGQRINVAAGRATLPDGTLAGSVLTMGQALRNAVAAGLSLAESSALLSRNPADALGRMDLGRIQPGAAADLLELDADLNLVRVIRAGREVDLA